MPGQTSFLRQTGKVCQHATRRGVIPAAIYPEDLCAALHGIPCSLVGHTKFPRLAPVIFALVRRSFVAFQSAAQPPSLSRVMRALSPASTTKQHDHNRLFSVAQSWGDIEIVIQNCKAGIPNHNEEDSRNQCKASIPDHYQQKNRNRVSLNL